VAKLSRDGWPRWVAKLVGRWVAVLEGDAWLLSCREICD
jgi:hypothetical protein